MAAAQARRRARGQGAIGGDRLAAGSVPGTSAHRLSHRACPSRPGRRLPPSRRRRPPAEHRYRDLIPLAAAALDQQQPPHQLRVPEVGACGFRRS